MFVYAYVKAVEGLMSRVSALLLRSSGYCSTNKSFDVVAFEFRYCMYFVVWHLRPVYCCCRTVNTHTYSFFFISNFFCNVSFKLFEKYLLH